MSDKRKPIPKDVRKRVEQKFGGHCAYCGCKPDKLQIDHLVPVYDAGTNRFDGITRTWKVTAEEDFINSEENLMPSCRQCNNYKNVLSLEYFRLELQKQVERAMKMSVNCRLAVKFNQMILNEHPIVFFFETYKGE